MEGERGKGRREDETERDGEREREMCVCACRGCAYGLPTQNELRVPLENMTQHIEYKGG